MKLDRENITDLSQMKRICAKICCFCFGRSYTHFTHCFIFRSISAKLNSPNVHTYTSYIWSVYQHEKPNINLELRMRDTLINPHHALFSTGWQLLVVHSFTTLARNTIGRCICLNLICHFIHCSRFSQFDPHCICK